METTHTSRPLELHSPGSFSPTVGDWVITSAQSPDPVTQARYTIVGRVPAHIEGNPLWDYPTDEELHAIALMFKAAPALLVALNRAELSTTQIRMAADIGRKSAKSKVTWYVGQLEQLGREIRAAIAQAEKD